ncbi:glycosyltransferase family 39 protein [Myxococcota bacterium]|nr:glycosyltransferase family 39 protein [Myxococcota bacterium]
MVGEVAIGWALGRPPVALVELDPPRVADGAPPTEATAAAPPPSAGHRWGPLVASLVRPVERLELGGLGLPLAINRYTGGPPDWPARLAWLLTRRIGAVTALHVALGGVLLVLVHRFLRFRGTDVAAAVAALVLASDWSFLFYKKVLGGTEVLLQAAFLLVLWALWSRRWGGGRHGLLALGVGVGLGLLAKATFALSLLALAATALLTRWDRPRMGAPDLHGLGPGLAAALLIPSPLVIAGLHHHLALPAPPPTHDFPALQVERVLAAVQGGPSPAREGLANLWWYASQPLAFFGPAYGVQDLPGPSPLRLAGLALVLAGTALAWRDRHPTPAEALLRFTSLLLLLQLGLLWLVARDLHHLAMATPTLAIVAGLALDRLAAVATPPRSPARARVALILALPLLIAGVRSLARTDAVVGQVAVPTFPRAGQAALADLLARHDVQRLLVADYESYGMLELRAPSVQVTHAWPAVARHGPRPPAGLLPALLGQAAGGHLLLVRASAPMAYNLRVSEGQLQQAAHAAGLRVTRVEALPADAAVLYQVEGP